LLADQSKTQFIRKTEF